MKKFLKLFIVFILCLLVYVVCINPTIEAKPNNPNKPNKPDKPTNPATLVEKIEAELDYIVNSSWTEENKNSKKWRFLQSTDDIYGAINSNRIPPQGVPARWAWVRPGISAMASVRMMQGVSYIYSQGVDISRYNSMLDKFFLVWVLEHNQGQNTDSQHPDFGAFEDRTDYDSNGNYVADNVIWKTDVTAQIMIANWKYYEYKVSIGQIEQADEWIINAWSIQKNAADYLVRMHDITSAFDIHLLPGNSTIAEYTAWIHFATNAVPALRGASEWAKLFGESFDDYDIVADDLVIGIQSMKDDSKNIYFKFVPYNGSTYGSPSYGDSIDQLVFSPYETGAVPIDDFAGQISDWWTNGDGEIKMTHQTDNSNDWGYYGTHWHYYFGNSPENDYLYPGPGFQLAKVEWKYGNSISSDIYLTRSINRLNWGTLTEYSSLWWFLTNEDEVRVPNGFLDWRNTVNYNQTAEVWARFVDTSAYFIEVLLMNEAEIDTDYNPILF